MAVTGSSGCHLVAAGASTGVGGTLAVSIAAFRAGLARTERVSFGAPGDEDAWCNAVRIGALSPGAAVDRPSALARSALAQAWLPLAEALRGCRIAAWSVGAPSLRPLLARQLGLPVGSVSDGGSHAAAGLYALGEARVALEEGRIDAALLVGAEVRSDESGLERERSAGRVLGGTSSFGTVPGEAAAALVLVSERLRASLGLVSLGQLLGAARAEEQVPHGGSAPCLGLALTEAIRSALAPLRGERPAAQVLCDLNGERERTDEWGFCVPRLAPLLAAPNAFITPIAAFGDVGAPAGLLLIALASGLWQRAEAEPCLIWASSRGSERAAALFEAAPSSATRGALAAGAARAPRWAQQLDASVLGELVEECAFRDEQRQYAASQAPEGDPNAVRAPLVWIETALDRLVQGLADCGPHAWERVEAALAAQPSPAALYTAARVLFEAGQVERAGAAVREHAPASAAHAGAARRALAHACPSGPAIGGLVEGWLGAGPVLAALGVELARHSGGRVPSAVLERLSEGLAEAPEPIVIGWLGTLAQLDPLGARPGIDRWLFSPREALRRRWAAAALALGGAEGRARVAERAAQDPAVVLPAALVVGADGARALRELASSLSGSDACLALGFLGDPLAVPHLLERLREPSLSGAAACALEMLLGSAPLGTRSEPDADEAAPPRAVPCISLDVDAWRALAEPVLAAHPPGTRLRAGTLAGVAPTLSLLERLHLPLRARRYLALELRVRWAARPSVDVEALLRQQSRALREVERWAAQTQPGPWG